MSASVVAAAGDSGAILTLDAALDGCSAGVVRDGVVVAARVQRGGRGSSAALPAMAGAVLREAGVAASALTGIAVTVGPGSFTGVRAALALAQGLALGAGVPVWGVTIGAALRAELAGVELLWVVVDSRRGRVFLDDGMTVSTIALDALPVPAVKVGLAGDAAEAAAARLGACGVVLRDGGPGPLGIAAGARGAALPLYVDPVEARPGPAGRPAPV